ncbi:MAG TPA: DUF1080 domain-containing protein [Prolixibacteraceae bacterium]|nr:DUF1080 domain-containing protein [Prolixibacteraceae bacterium]
MKKLFSYLLAGTFVFTLACQSGQKKTTGETTEVKSEEAGLNQLSEKEKADGWVLMFDGTTSNGWRGVNKDHFPTGWEVVDGTLHCKASGKGEAGATDGGDILYDKEFSNFILKLEWKISEGGNSGIFYLGKEVEGWPIYKTAPEMQILDNERHPDALLGKDGNRKAGSLYDLIPANPQNAKPAGEWNTVEIMVYQGTVVHKQNGETVLEYHLWTDDWNKLVAGSKFPGLNPDWANVPQAGVIALQDHGNDVWFRNIKIKEL